MPEFATTETFPYSYPKPALPLPFRDQGFVLRNLTSLRSVSRARKHTEPQTSLPGAAGRVFINSSRAQSPCARARQKRLAACMMAEGSGEVHQSERVSEQQTPEETNEGLSLVSVFRGHKLHPTVWTPTSAESAKLVTDY